MTTINELRVFVAAAELESFSEASERLNLSQPALSQNIRSLERAFQTELFVRDGRSVRLSEAGRALLPLATNAIGSIRHLEHAMSHVEGDVRGELVIGCSTSSGRYVLPLLGARFIERYPHVRFRVLVHS